MNDEEFIKEAREGAAAPIQNSFGADCLRETLDRLAAAEKRIEELEAELERLKPVRVQAARIIIEED